MIVESPSPGSSLPRVAGSSWLQDRRNVWVVTLLWTTAYLFTVIQIANVTFGALTLEFKEIWLPLLAIALFLITRRFALATALAPHINFGMVLVLGWMLLSAAWSPVPGLTITQSIAVIGVSLIAMAFTLYAWRPGRFEDALTAVVTFVLLASLVYALLFPTIGIHSEDDFSLFGSWRGITYQKNALGQVAIVGVILWTFRLLTRRNGALLCWAGIAFSVFMLLKSRSNTSLMVALLSCALMLALLRPALRIGRTGRQLAFGSMLIFVPLMGYLAVGTDLLQPIGEFFGKGITFSGRADIWHEVFIEIRKHPIVGLGYNSFWHGEGSLSGPIIQKLGWGVSGAHNGYIDIINELGVIGFAFFGTFLALHAAALARVARVDRIRFALLTALFLQLVLIDFSESGWFRPVTQTHLLGMYCSLEASRILLQHRLLRARRTAPDNPGTPVLASPPSAGRIR